MECHQVQGPQTRLHHEKCFDSWMYVRSYNKKAYKNDYKKNEVDPKMKFIKRSALIGGCIQMEHTQIYIASNTLPKGSKTMNTNSM